MVIGSIVDFATQARPGRYLRRAARDADAELALVREYRADAEADLSHLVANAFLVYADDELLERSGDVDDADLAALIDESAWQVDDRGLREVVKPLVSEMRSAFKLAGEYLATCVSQRAVPDEARAAVLTGIPDIDSRLLDDVVDTLRERGEFGESEHQAFMIGQTAVRAARAQVASAERQTRDRRLDEATAASISTRPRQRRSRRDLRA